MNGIPVPTTRQTAGPTPADTRLPLRIRVRSTTDRCYVDWEAFEALVQVARTSHLRVDVECITANGRTVVLSLV